MNKKIWLTLLVAGLGTVETIWALKFKRVKREIGFDFINNDNNKESKDNDKRWTDGECRRFGKEINEQISREYNLSKWLPLP